MQNEFDAGFQKLGIREPVGQTVVIATFPMLNKGPDGSINYVDVQARNTAVWLTTPCQESDLDMVIGPDGKASEIGIEWADGTPVFKQQTPQGFKSISHATSDSMNIVNLPSGERAYVTSKEYPGYVETYTVFQLQQDEPKPELLNPFIGTHKLISGMKNRGLIDAALTSFFGIRVIDKTNIPYGKEVEIYHRSKTLR